MRKSPHAAVVLSRLEPDHVCDCTRTRTQFKSECYVSIRVGDYAVCEWTHGQKTKRRLTNCVNKTTVHRNGNILELIK